jgi:hypothetical protein
VIWATSISRRCSSGFDQAVAELERAVEVALEIPRSAEHADDDSFINEVIARTTDQFRTDEVGRDAPSAILGAWTAMDVLSLSTYRRLADLAAKGGRKMKTYNKIPRQCLC